MLASTSRRAGLAVALLLAIGGGVAAGWNVDPPRTAGSGTPAPSATAAPAPTATVHAQPTRTAQLRVGLYGDGLLDGLGLPDAQSLPALLTAARPDVLVVDLGLGHESSDKMLTRVRDATEAHLDVVVIWAGSYDAAGGVSAQQYASNVGALLDDFKGTRVVLLPPIALRGGGAGVGPYRAALQGVAQQRGVAVTAVDGALAGADWQDGGQDLGPKADAALAALLRGLLP
ncbi:MAG TPA: SGNH/GDSL hydrolase family protein [Candidatus Dormibacteraeota bacterium]|jgi:hypothetical protein|nr:SGNH/GDSL hydrolase family protein [Candidatus Dormibacteraeota bacterium]